MKQEADIWLKLAEEDYQDMGIMMERNRYRGAVLFAQQAVEKILKAYIAECTTDAPKKIHRLERLIKDTDLNLSELGNPPIHELSIAYEWARYADLSRSHFRSKKDVEKLLVMAKQLFVWVRTKFKNR
jgi:HEPN domain-containing protein